MKYSFYLTLLLWIASGQGNAAVLRVNAGSSCTSGCDGSNFTTLAYSTLQAALSAAQDGDEIWVAAGTYHADAENLGESSAFFNAESLDNIAIYGGFNLKTPTMENRNWVLHPTILTGQYTNGGGATIRILRFGYQHDIVVDGFILEGSRNNATSGYGTALRMHEAQNVQLRNCIIRDTKALGFEGRGCLQINDFSTLKVINCLFTNNTGGIGSIAFAHDDSEIELINCTIADNTMIEDASNAAISFEQTGGQVFYYNTIIWNSGSAPGEADYDRCVLDFSASGTNYSQNPQLDANFKPTTGSIAMDNGLNSYNTETVDLDLNLRIENGTIDIGAYEFVGPAGMSGISNEAFEVSVVRDVEGTFWIHSSGKMISHVRSYDLTGILVNEMNVGRTGTPSVDLTQQAAGMYMLEVHSNQGEVTTIKVIR